MHASLFKSLERRGLRSRETGFNATLGKDPPPTTSLNQQELDAALAHAVTNGRNLLAASSFRKPRQLQTLHRSIAPHAIRVRDAIRFWLEQSLVHVGVAIRPCRNPSTYLRRQHRLRESSCTLLALVRSSTVWGVAGFSGETGLAPFPATKGDIRVSTGIRNEKFGNLILSSLQSRTRSRTKVGCRVPLRANRRSQATPEIRGPAHLLLSAVLGF